MELKLTSTLIVILGGYLIMTINTNTFNSFINSCNSLYVPDYIHDYVSSLTKRELDKFYSDYKTASSYLIDDKYLIYKLRWILKVGYDNLLSSLFIELVLNVEGFNLNDIICTAKFNQLVTLYGHLNPRI